MYTMQEGDTLWNVAVRIYGDGQRHAHIRTANNFTDEDVENLSVGARIIIPE